MYFFGSKCMLGVNLVFNHLQMLQQNNLKNIGGTEIFKNLHKQK